MKTSVRALDEKLNNLTDEQLDILTDIICVGEEFALLRETLRLYAEELEQGVTVH
jgi:hypothetical protein